MKTPENSATRGFTARIGGILHGIRESWQRSSYERTVTLYELGELKNALITTTLARFGIDQRPLYKKKPGERWPHPFIWTVFQKPGRD